MQTRLFLPWIGLRSHQWTSDRRRIPETAAWECLPSLFTALANLIAAQKLIFIVSGFFWFAEGILFEITAGAFDYLIDTASCFRCFARPYWIPHKNNFAAASFRNQFNRIFSSTMASSVESAPLEETEPIMILDPEQEELGKFFVYLFAPNLDGLRI